MTDSAAPHVLIVTTRADVTADYLVLDLTRRGVPFYRLNTEDLPEYATSSFGVDGGPISWKWESGRHPVELSSVQSIWYRRHRLPLLDVEMPDGTKDFCLREVDWFVRGALLSRSVRWMSHPTAVAAAEAKLFQLAVAYQLGFNIPATLVTNDPTETRRFVESRGTAIAKPIRTGYVDDGAHGLAIFSNLITLKDLESADESIRLAPVIYQQFIDKVCDVRITIVGERVFAAQIDSQGVESARIDWRRSESDNLPHTAVKLPLDLSTRCRMLLDRLGLAFGAIDMVVDATGTYYFLEVNPTGQWAWLQEKLGFNISGAIADWLVQSPSEPT